MGQARKPSWPRKLQYSISKIKRTLSSNDNTHIMEVAKIFMSYIEVPGLIHVPYPPPSRVNAEGSKDSFSLDPRSESKHLQDLSTAMIGLLEISRNLKFRRKLRISTTSQDSLGNSFFSDALVFVR